MAQITMAKALNAALRDAMEADDRVVLLGEDVGMAGRVSAPSSTTPRARRRCMRTPPA
jgi:2-oxoisovalerate dehydrogenase E1 component beta subunit